MGISKYELYEITEKVVEDKTKFVNYIFFFFLTLSVILLITGIVLSNFQMLLISLFIALFIVNLIKIFDLIKIEYIRKVVKNYDESGI